MFTSGNLDCEITENPIPSGFDDSYEAYALDGVAGSIGNTDGCQFAEIIGGDFRCEITNTAQDAIYEVNKVWDVIGPAGDKIKEIFGLAISCDQEILSASPNPDHGPGQYEDSYVVRWLYLEGDTTVSITVDSSNGTARCSARERIFDDAVSTDNPCRSNRLLTPGQTTFCTITNTVFF